MGIYWEKSRTPIIAKQTQRLEQHSNVDETAFHFLRAKLHVATVMTFNIPLVLWICGQTSL
jgi:hypothetical protein